MAEKRVVCLNCMDGRAQIPVIGWVKDNYGADYVDMVTEPGMDGLLAGGSPVVEGIFSKVRLSIEKNDAEMIFIAAHHDCRGNPVDDAVHQDHIRLAVKRLKKEFSGLDVVGIWINKGWEGEAVK